MFASRMSALRYSVLTFAVSCFCVAPVDAQSLTTVSITDPAYGIKAFTIAIPAGWKFQGTVVRGPECNPISFPAFRAYSPDGLTEMRLLPVFNWTFHPAIRWASARMTAAHHTDATAAQLPRSFVEMIAQRRSRGGDDELSAQPYRERVGEFAAGLNANNRTPGFHATVRDTAACESRRSMAPSSSSSDCARGLNAARYRHRRTQR